MSNVAINETVSSRMDRCGRNARRKKHIKNVKTGGDLMMYVGSAGLMIPMIRKAREQENGVMGICAAGAGAVLAIGLGNIASNILNKTIDKVVDFWNDVKPGEKPVKETKDDEAQEESENG